MISALDLKCKCGETKLYISITKVPVRRYAERDGWREGARDWRCPECYKRLHGIGPEWEQMQREAE